MPQTKQPRLRDHLGPFVVDLVVAIALPLPTGFTTTIDHPGRQPPLLELWTLPCSYLIHQVLGTVKELVPCRIPPIYSQLFTFSYRRPLEMPNGQPFRLHT